ncbi:MAG: hypothetical protein ACREU8_07435 [Gammaproteobacteria bacterium]
MGISFKERDRDYLESLQNELDRAHIVDSTAIPHNAGTRPLTVHCWTAWGRIPTQRASASGEGLAGVFPPLKGSATVIAEDPLSFGGPA